MARLLLQGVDTSKGPILSTQSVSSIFFHRTAPWLRVNEKILGIKIADFGERRRYTLSEIEMVAHEMRNGGKISDQELTRVLRIVHAIALAWDYI